MKNITITYEDIAKLYDELKLSSQYPESLKVELSYEQVTNRNFGIKDYTTSTNSTEIIENYAKCSIDE